MNKKQFRQIVGFILTAVLLLGTLIIASGTVAAQRRARRVVIGETVSSIPSVWLQSARLLPIPAVRF